MPKTSPRPPVQFEFDLICIGSGSAGGSAAVAAARSGLRVALVEGSTLGGESANHSCVPVNALLQAVSDLETARNGFAAGVDAGRVSLNWEKTLAFKDDCVKSTGVSDSANAFSAAGVELLTGFAQFVDPWTINVGSRQLTGRKIIIATGSTTHVPPIEGLEKCGFITFKEALKRPRPPASLFIIGGGMTGCALAEIFNAAGSRVCLAEAAGHLLPREDQEVGQVVEEIFKTKGVNVLTTAQIGSVKLRDDGQKEIALTAKGEVKNIIVEEILVAAGRIPRLDLNLQAAGVQFDNDGIKVNRFLETTASHIYAVGDVIGHDMLTHLAAQHSRLAVHNLGQTKTKDKLGFDYAAVSRYLALTPEVAATGLTEAELHQQSLPFMKAMVPVHGLIRSRLSNRRAGFVKLLCAPDGRLVGGSVIAPSAGEMIGQLSLAINAGLGVNEFKNNLKPFTSWSEAFNLACQKIR